MALTCRWRSRPQHQKRTHAVQQRNDLFDDLIGAGEQRRRHVETERLCGLAIDDKLVLARCLDWKVGWFFAFEDAIHIGGRKRKLIALRSIGDQSTKFSKKTPRIDSW